MNNSLVKKYCIFLVFLFAVVYCSFYGWEFLNSDILEKYIDGEGVTFNLESGVYDKDIEIKLSKNIEFPFLAHIFYTTNGDDPRVSGTLYDGSICLELEEGINVYPIKAVAGIHGRFSEISERTYILTKDIEDKYDIDIVSITCDQDSLYNYETGIMIPGITYDRNAQDSSLAYIPGNYNNRTEEWIKDGHIIMVNKNGEIIIDQNIGIGISGATSAALPIKSLKIYADRKYDENYNFFDIELDNTDMKVSAYSFVNQYKSIRLRSGSQDLQYGANIKSAVASRLSEKSNFDGCTGSRRCIVFLNGEFYGIFDMQQNYSDSYLSNRFGLPDSDAIEKIKLGELEIINNLGLRSYFEQDLNIEINREALEDIVDMDNYLMYYAVEIMCNNMKYGDIQVKRYLIIHIRTEDIDFYFLILI